MKRFWQSLETITRILDLVRSVLILFWTLRG